VDERPRLHIVVSPTVEILKLGLYVEVDDLVHAFLYDNAENPFVRGRSYISPGQGAVQKSFYDPEFSLTADCL
jgi:hypothetical protein